jgi:hypothetical protein
MPCRAANAAYYHQRQTLARAAAGAIAPGPGPVPQTWTDRHGQTRTRWYSTGACSGPAPGTPCPRRAHLRKDSTGGVCAQCRHSLIWNGLVDAAPVRRHLIMLSRRGVGYKAVADACDVSKTVLLTVRRATKARVRKSTADRVLAVTVGAIADHALVPAGRTWRLVRKLLDEGYTKSALAQRLGAKTRALQLGKTKVLAKTQLRVEKLYRFEVVA